MRQRGNKNLSFPPAFRDLSEKLLVKYSQLYKLAVLPFSVNKMNTQETKLQPFQHHTFYVSVTKQCSDWLVFLTVLSEQPIRTLFGK